MPDIDLFSFVGVTVALSYVMACVGSALGLRCTVRALTATGRSRRNWLLAASGSIGTGIWTMHFIAMLGFGVPGSHITYDVPLTVLSLLTSVVVVGMGVFTVGYGRSRIRSILLGGLGTGLGVAAMHYVGMAAVHVHGGLHYDLRIVGLSVVIAVVAATGALVAALIVRGTASTVVASIIMGLAVSCMHYTGMASVRAHVHPGTSALSGAPAPDFILPLAVLLGSFLFLTSAFVALSPEALEARESAVVDRLIDAGAPNQT
ncbi:MHYT domain-containing protein [Streptomyces sp. MZ04]|uniref:MHYT domain-containing protein n=1 Tax=Streptomyces sp. MZ04 TaxID=2559236 RepID=UPI00107EDF62|nr:MHYT domain-containing protein [Streptomyces sp. MZ04]TGB08244.1 hypothetical protein E2651_19730 [Streptomyces sp. MZ04]